LGLKLISLLFPQIPKFPPSFNPFLGWARILFLPFIKLHWVFFTKRRPSHLGLVIKEETLLLWGKSLDESLLHKEPVVHRGDHLLRQLLSDRCWERKTLPPFCDDCSNTVWGRSGRSFCSPQTELEGKRFVSPLVGAHTGPF